MADPQARLALRGVVSLYIAYFQCLSVELIQTIQVLVRMWGSSVRIGYIYLGGHGLKSLETLALMMFDKYFTWTASDV